jgi:D-tyrosyl-tRNA(Tyr) deacylase
VIVVLQRVARAAVRVDGREAASIGKGLCLLACAVDGDGEADATALADKIATLRVFEDARGATNLGLAEVGGAALVVPQFTLAADWRKGRRPSFTAAAAPPAAQALLAAFAQRLAAQGVPVASGVFGAQMAVELVNDGPFTLVLDSRVLRERSPESRA